MFHNKKQFGPYHLTKKLYLIPTILFDTMKND